jgi:hypothetical protein
LPGKRIQQAIGLEGLDRLPVAPVITGHRDAFEGLVQKHEGLVREFDGFILHPKVFDSAYVYVPSKPSLPEPIPLIKSMEEYDDLSALGPLDFALKAHREAGLVKDLSQRMQQSADQIKKFNKIWEGRGVSSYCGVMAITPMGYLSYYRGIGEVLKDMGRDSSRFLSVSMDIAQRYPNFLEEYTKITGIPRAWVSFAYSSPMTAGKYYFERYVWPPAKSMIKTLVAKGITPILQFDEPVEDYRFLKELPPRKCLLHINNGQELEKASEQLAGSFCMAGNLPLSHSPEDLQRLMFRIKTLNFGTGLIISTEGSSPFVLTDENVGELARYKQFIAQNIS